MQTGVGIARMQDLAVAGVHYHCGIGGGLNLAWGHGEKHHENAQKGGVKIPYEHELLYLPLVPSVAAIEVNLR